MPRYCHNLIRTPTIIPVAGTIIEKRGAPFFRWPFEGVIYFDAYRGLVKPQGCSGRGNISLIPSNDECQASPQDRISELFTQLFLDTLRPRSRVSAKPIVYWWKLYRLPSFLFTIWMLRDELSTAQHPCQANKAQILRPITSAWNLGNAWRAIWSWRTRNKLETLNSHEDH
jgi:hypothetical protein